jgi:DNA primase
MVLVAMSDSLDDVKRRILTRVDLASLVGEAVKLTRASGGRQVGCCPFHNEDSPSFNVYDDNHYFCFGCKVHGDAITWMRQREGLSFIEALRHLAGKYGIEAPELAESQGRLAKQRSDAILYNMMSEAQLFFVTNLEGPDGPDARAYLEQRGFTAASVKDFGFGLTPREPFGLVRHLARKGFNDHDMKAVGLMSVNATTGRSFDFFRNRVMLPIHDAQGRVVGFGGRTLEPGGNPKYLNTGATVLFDKSHTLFGFDKARRKMREKGRAIVVEGYMDCLMLWQHGFDEAVACLGTAFTEHHVRLLKNATNNVTLLFDGDSPGQSAALKTVEVALKFPDTYIKAATLTDDQDPDTFVREAGADALAALLGKAADLFDFAIQEKIRQSHQLSLPELIGKEFVPWLARLPDRMQRMLLANRIAARTGIKLEVIERELLEFARSEAQARQVTQLRAQGAHALAPPPYGSMRDAVPASAPLTVAASKPLEPYARELFANVFFAAPGELDLPALSQVVLGELELDEAHAQLWREFTQLLALGKTPAEAPEPPVAALDPIVAALLDRLRKDAAAFQYSDGRGRAARVAAVVTAIRAQGVKAQIKDLNARLVRAGSTPEGVEEARKILVMIRDLQRSAGV